MSVDIYEGDCREVMANLQEKSVHCCVTSPPYFGLRDYGNDDQIGLEQTPDEFVEALVGVFREVKRVLRDDGTVWLNLGDSYCNSNGFARASANYQREGRNDAPANDRNLKHLHAAGYKTKDLIGIPWRVAFALQADGWYLRQDIVWNKPNVMPEAVKDRCTKSHEYIFLLSKSPKYYYDYEAVKEDAVYTDHKAGKGKLEYEGKKSQGEDNGETNSKKAFAVVTEKRNRRSVWTVSPKAFHDAHFAVYPPELIEPCILAGCPEGGTVLDPFGGSGTTGVVADRLKRNAILVELNQNYIEIAKNRIENDAGLFADLSIIQKEANNERV